MVSVATGYKPGKLDGRRVMTWRKGANNRGRRFRLPALEIGRPRSLIMLLYYAVPKPCGVVRARVRDGSHDVG